ncbi:MAG: hypothetical protein MUE96_03845 [Bacteroidia bacterium]|jgi:dTDP-4-amino-4,6-dideoxy-D-galactose acyltransferase|nr:hypothetical protein [Bacteroidia bacterium]
MGQLLTDASQYRENVLNYYAPFRAIRPLPLADQRKIWVEPELNLLLNDAIEIEIGNNVFWLLLEHLTWDTAFFNMPTYKLVNILFDAESAPYLADAVKQLQSVLPIGAYVFTEIPSEDITVLNALTSAGWPLIETRLTYWRGDLASFNQPRYAVRRATVNDIPNLKRVAKEMKNPYDRFHADKVFSEQLADEFLATYIEESIKGFADVVLVPDAADTPSDSFLTARYLKPSWQHGGVPISKMVLSAVSATTNKGWYQKLISEMTYHLKDQGAEYIFMNTQSTNLAVCYTWEKLGYRLGGTSHILRMPITQITIP